MTTIAKWAFYGCHALFLLACIFLLGGEVTAGKISSLEEINSSGDFRLFLVVLAFLILMLIAVAHLRRALNKNQTEMNRHLREVIKCALWWSVLTIYSIPFIFVIPIFLLLLPFTIFVWMEAVRLAILNRKAKKQLQ